MVAAAQQNNLTRIIYLGGLGEADHESLSKHLKSRHEVEKILMGSSVPVTNLRAAMILGAGSASFEMLRYLVDRLPAMITPRWVQTPCQPISIRNVLDYLEGCTAGPETVGQTLDIGGAEVLTYRDLIQIYAEEAGLRKRLIIPVPVLTPWLSAKWIHLVTPVPASIAQPLAEGLSIPVVCRDARIHAMVPVKLIDSRQTIRTALDRVRQEKVDTCWFDGGGALPPEWVTCGDADYAGGTILRGAHRIVLEATRRQRLEDAQADRRPQWLVFRPAALAAARIIGSSRRRPGYAQRAARPGRSASGRRPRFLAGDRPGPSLSDASAG
jgi:hypothetical protein